MSKVRRKLIESRVKEAESILPLLGLPAEQQNARSALTLLALLNLSPSAPWSEATSQLIGVTPIMEFIQREYNVTYAPNSRETIRRYTLHQFIQAGLVEQNPDDPLRPTNSPKNVYQISSAAISVLKKFGTTDWDNDLQSFIANVGNLAARYASDRAMKKVSLVLDSETSIAISPGGQNDLIKAIIDEFCPRFAPAAIPIYVGDTAEKWAFFDEQKLRDIGVVVHEHGKIPDVVIYLPQRNWVILIEAVTSHGPISPKRARELKELFQGCHAGLVLMTAFPDAKTFARFAKEVAWETEVWIADAPSHMIHFNGERFLGPYSDTQP